jgi:hypothetical protein
VRGLALVVLLAAGPHARATGPSSIEVRVVPVAVSAKGAVLFKTWRELRPEGAQGAQPAEVGWLVVSGEGLWLEVSHAVVSDVEHDEARYYRLRKEFQAAFEWKNPPKSVRPLLARFDLAERDRVAPDLGRGAVTWSPKKICLGSRCADCSARQWAPGGIVSEEGQGTPTAAEFHAAGVALFSRTLGPEESPGGREPPGAIFRLPPHRYWDEREGLVDLGYEMERIDAIAIVPKALRDHAASSPAR